MAAGWARGPDGVRQRGVVPLALELLTNDDPSRAELAASLAPQLRARTRRYRPHTARGDAAPRPHRHAGVRPAALRLAGRCQPGPVRRLAYLADHLGRTQRRRLPRRPLRCAARAGAVHDGYGRAQRALRTRECALYGAGAQHRASLSTRAVRTARALAGATDGVLFTLGSRFHDAHLWPVAPSQ